MRCWTTSRQRIANADLENVVNANNIKYGIDIIANGLKWNASPKLPCKNACKAR